MGGTRGRLISSADRLTAIELISSACHAGSRKSQACKILGLSLRTVQRWDKEKNKIDRRQLTKKTPKNKLTLEEREMILRISNSKKYRDSPPCKIVPMLADEGKYIASESSFYRILHAENQLVHRGHTQPRKHNKPKPFIAKKPNQVWSWDISFLPTQIKGLYFYLYVIVDIYSRKIVGWNVHEKESSENASYLIQQACCDEKVARNQIVLHSDNGAPMKGLTMLAMLEKLGVLPSFSRPSVSDDNPYSESLFKTLKYHSTFPVSEKFAAIEDARKWCEKFSKWYNEQHLHSGLKFITPAQRHSGKDKMIMQNRHDVYQKAKRQHPERWSANSRNWSLPKFVALNPNKGKIKHQNKGTVTQSTKINVYPHEQDSTKNLAIVGKHLFSQGCH